MKEEKEKKQQEAACGEDREPVQVRISVRSLVEFLLRSGDLDNRIPGAVEAEAMQAGSRIHRKLQKRMGSGYRAEVSLKYDHDYPHCTLRLEGRADGIFEENGQTVVDEIKGTYQDVLHMENPKEVHLAQAKCYGAILLGQHPAMGEISVQMTYCQLETELVQRFRFSYTREELLAWFDALLDAYEKWAELQVLWTEKRDRSMEDLDFPFPYRQGQKKLVRDIYLTLQRKKQLFVQASTGVGKTMSAVYPSVRAMGEGLAEKIFYLTAKTITRTVAEEAFGILQKKGLACKVLTITAKEKICACEEVQCDPDSCLRARGHYDRINDCLYEMLTQETSYRREQILAYSEKWQVCPYELELELTWFMDCIICDYNYVLDPTVKLRRFFGEGSRSGDYIFLIDEAHNLVERAREMYSAVICKEDFMEVRKLIRPLDGGLAAALSGCNKYLNELKAECETCCEYPHTDQLILSLLRMLGKLEGFLEAIRKGKIHPGMKTAGGRKRRKKKKVAPGQLQLRFDGSGAVLTEAGEDSHPEDSSGLSEGVEPAESREEAAAETVGAAMTEAEFRAMRKRVLEFYFDVRFFAAIYELLDENYIVYGRRTGQGRFLLKLFCVNPAKNLQSCLDQGRAAVYLSATLLPIQYYRGLLSGRGSEDYAVYVPSPFDPARRYLTIGADVSSKYSRRSPEEYLHFAEYIHRIVSARAGNYMVFCPSYKVLQEIYETYAETFQKETVSCICQSPGMAEEDRERFLERFHQAGQGTLVGFCVMGGIFAEGIDLTGEKLIGAILIGPGLPQVGEEKELLRACYDRQGKDGFDYAYRFPGMNKVLQAAGRVIRTDGDRGVIALLDERFCYREYRGLFPREWDRVEISRLQNISGQLKAFWDLDS